MFAPRPKPKVPYLIATGDENIVNFAIRNAEYTPRAVAVCSDTANVVQAWQSANTGVTMLRTGDFVYVPVRQKPKVT